MKNAFDGILSKLDTVGESLSSRIHQQKPLKLKSKENKGWGKNQNKISKDGGNYKRYNTCIVQIPRKERKERNI